MEPVLYLSKIVAELGDGDNSQEVCATADANYDCERGLVIVELDSLIRPSGFVGARTAADWLPKRANRQGRWSGEVSAPVHASECGILCSGQVEIRRNSLRSASGTYSVFSLPSTPSSRGRS